MPIEFFSTRMLRIWKTRPSACLLLGSSYTRLDNDDDEARKYAFPRGLCIVYGDFRMQCNVDGRRRGYFEILVPLASAHRESLGSEWREFCDMAFALSVVSINRGLPTNGAFSIKPSGRRA